MSFNMSVNLMSLFLTGLVAFLGVHSIHALMPALRARLQAALGDGPYRGAFSILAILSFCLLIYGFGIARTETGILYTPPTFLAHITLTLMVIAFVVLAAGFLPSGYIATFAKHPQVLAVKIWAFAHLLANGETAQVLLFGGFLAWGVLMRISFKRRERRGEGTARVYKSWYYDVIALVAGLVLYGAFVMGLHEWLIGVPVMVTS